MNDHFSKMYYEMGIFPSSQHTHLHVRYQTTMCVMFFLHIVCCPEGCH